MSIHFYDDVQTCSFQSSCHSHEIRTKTNRKTGHCNWICSKNISGDCCCPMKICMRFSNRSGRLHKYCDILCYSLWDCSLLAEPILSVDLHLKVRLCNNQDNLFLLLRMCLYRCDFLVFGHLFFISESLQFLLFVLDPTVKLCQC